MKRLLIHGTIALAFALALAGCASFRLPQMPTGSVASVVPTSIESAVRLAQTQRANGDLDGAMYTLAQLILVAPDDPRVLGEYGKTLVDKGETDDALAFLRRATGLQPEDWSLFSALGVAYAQSDDYVMAQDAFSHALSLKPDEPTVLNNSALAYLQTGDLDKAEALLRRAAQNGAAFPQIAQNLALVRRLNSPKDPRGPAPIDPAPKNPAVASSISSYAKNSEVATIAFPRAAELVSRPIDPVEISIELVDEEIDRITGAPPLALAAEVPSPVPQAKPTVGPFHIQVGAYGSMDNAERVSVRLVDLGARVSTFSANGQTIHRVRLGPFLTADEAYAMLEELGSRGFDDGHLLSRAAQVNVPEATPALRLSENIGKFVE